MADMTVPLSITPASISIPVALAPSPISIPVVLAPALPTIPVSLQAVLRGERGLDGAAGQDGADADLSADIHAAPAKAAPDDSDELGYLDSAGSWALVKASWAQLKAALKTSFDTVYLPQTGGTLAGGTVTASTPVLTVNQTWNNAGTTFTGKVTNITDTASNASSLIEEWQVGGVTLVSLLKNGGVRLNSGNFAGLAVGGIVFGTASGDGVVTNAGVANGQVCGYSGGTQKVALVCGQGLNLESASAVSWTATSSSQGTRDVILARDAANTLAQRNGTNAQTFRLYNTYTDASNYERGFMRWNANVLEIGTEALGTGSNRALWLKAMGATIKWDGSSFQWGTTAAMFAAGLSLASNVIVAWSNTYNGGLGGYTTAIGRSASGLVEITNGTTGAYRDLILRNLTAAGYQELGEMTAPAAPATNNVRIYAEDNGAGKTRLMALFATGAAVQIAIEP